MPIGRFVRGGHQGQPRALSLCEQTPAAVDQMKAPVIGDACRAYKH